MQIETSQQDAKVRVSIQGTINEKGAEELKSCFKQLSLATVEEVEIDCGRVQHIGSSGIGKILLLYKALTSQGGKLAVVNLPGPIHELFTELKLDTLFTVTRQA
ncbi:STAS domain-containing protein [Desulfurivibrio sp. D14AmB]|uniref:STAS domain-containing protein n=1 Tax=Desulfurivibrio sp. D14AmB TaxID=3374370 RepID=UPI00376EDA9B